MKVCNPQLGLTILEMIDWLNIMKMDNGELLVWPTVCLVALAFVSIVGILSVWRCALRYRRLKMQTVMELRAIRAADRQTAATLRAGWHQPFSDLVSELERGGWITVLHEAVGRLAIREGARFSSSFLNFAVGAVLILGLAGTFAAFAELIAGSGLGSTENIEEGIQIVVRNLKLSFIASISGVVCSVILHFCSSVIVRPARQQFLVDLEVFGEECCRAFGGSSANSCVREEHGELKSVAESLQLAAPALVKAADRLEGATKGTPEKIGEILEAILVEMSKGEERYARLVATAKSCETAIGGVTESTKQALKEQIEGFGRRQVEVFEKADQVAAVFGKQIAEQNAKSLEAFQKGIADLGVENQKQGRTLSEAANSLLARIEADRVESDKLLRTVVDDVTASLSECTTTAIERLESAYNATVGDWSAQIQLAKDQRELATELQETIRGNLGSLSDRAGQIIQDSSEALQKLSASAAGLEASPELLQTAIGELGDGLNGIRQSSDELGSIIKKVKADTEGVFRGVAGKLDSLDEQLRQVIELGRVMGFKPKKPLLRRLMFWKN
jgi:hypothetical protein